MLDCAQTQNDRAFLERLRELDLPMTYGWLEGDDFQFSPACPLYVP
jgi:hypothetical protein